MPKEKESNRLPFTMRTSCLNHYGDRRGGTRPFWPRNTIPRLWAQVRVPTPHRTVQIFCQLFSTKDSFAILQSESGALLKEL